VRSALTRSIGLTLASAGCAATLALTLSAPTLAANKALMVNGIAAGELTDIAMANILGGMFGGKGIVRQNVPWPQQSRPVTGPDSLSLTESVAQGVVNLDGELTEALAQLGPGEKVTIVGLSGGALVVNDVMRELASDPNAPDKSQVTFVVIADSSRVGFNRNRYDGIIGYQYRLPAETKYDTLAVAAEYDGFADFPDRWWNFLAVANAFAGTIVEHIPAMLTDLDTVPAENITVTTNSLGGVTTSYLIPAKRLPLVLLLPFLAPQEASLKETIDSAYARNDNKSTAAAVSATTEPVGAPADTPAITPEITPEITPASEDVPSPPEAPIADTAPSVTEVTSNVTKAPAGAVALDAPDVGTARTTDTAVADTAVSDTSAADAAVTETPFADTAVTDAAVTETPVADTAVTETSVADTKAPTRRTNRAPAAASDSPEPERNTVRRSSAQRPSA
jgi:hypothetical protein